MTKQKNENNKRNGILGLVGLFIFAFVVASISVIIYNLAAPQANINMFIPIGFGIGMFVVLLFIFSYKEPFDSNVVYSVCFGFICGLLVSASFIAPPLSYSYLYPYSLQVLYPNHPNLTITQNCTPFIISVSGYHNGQPINPKNTTDCILPYSIAQNATNPFDCYIDGKNISCSEAIFGVGNETWDGTILNISKR